MGAVEGPESRRSASSPGGVPAFVRAKRQGRVDELRRELVSLLGSAQDCVLEFGCGHGHWLTAYAEAHPGQQCFGIDLISARVRKSHAKRERFGLRNVHFLKAEATELLEAWPEDRPVGAVFMLFPDPWPKKRHHKNRMIQTPFLDQVAGRMPAGARFHFRTDDAGYFEWTREHFESHPAWRIDEAADWPWETPTYFQQLMESWSSLIAVREP